MPERAIYDIPVEPCPCGEYTRLFTAARSWGGDGPFYVWCERCGSEGPDAESEAEAVRKWNAALIDRKKTEPPKVIPRCTCGRKVDVIAPVNVAGEPVEFYVYCGECFEIHERAEERAEAVWSWCRRRYAEMSTWEHMRFLFEKANFLLEALRFKHGRRAGWYAWIVGIVLPILFAAGITTIIRIL